MKAIILAAGRGSRMSELTEKKPKCLITIGNQTLLDWQLNACTNSGIKEIGIVTGYKREMLASQTTYEFHNPSWQTTNMVASLFCAQNWLSTEPCIVSYSDIFYEADAIKTLLNAKANLAITYVPNWHLHWKNRFVNPLSDAESFQLDSKGYLTEIGNKVKAVTEIQGQYMGLLKFTPESWLEMKRLCYDSNEDILNNMHLTHALQKIIKYSQIKIKAIPYERIWGEIDSKSDLTYYNKRYFENI